MIYDVHVYDAFAADFDNEGIAGALTPTSCVHDAIAGNLGDLTLTHPLDEAGKWTALVRGNIIKAWTRVRTVAEFDGDKIVTSVEKWTVKETSSKAEREIYNKKAEGRKLGSMKKGESVLVVLKPADGDRVKVKTSSLTGWVNPAALEYETTQTLPETDPTAIEDIFPAWSMKEQLFRIYDEERTLTAITVRAYPIFGDLLGNMTVYKNNEAVSLYHAAEKVLERCAVEHDFTAHTNIADLRTGVNWRHKSPIYAFFDPEEGMVAKWGCQAVIDNYEITLMKQAGKNRGMSVEYAKNLTGISFNVTDEEVVTCVLPTGVNEDGKVLYRTDDEDELNSENWIFAENAESYPKPHVYHLECEDCTVSEDLSIGKARERMVEQAYEFLESGVTLPTVNIKVTFAELGSAEEYAAWKELLHMDLYDKVSVIVPKIGFTGLLDVVRVSTDCITGRTLEAEIGALSDVQITIANYQISGISGGKIFAGTITAPQLGSGIIHAQHITANTITTQHLRAGSITTEKLVAGAIIADTIDTDAIIARHIQSDAIETRHLTSGSVTADKIQAGAIETTHITTGTLDAKVIKTKTITAELGLLGDGVIGTAQIENGSITAAKIVSLNADVIDAGTLKADRIVLEGDDGLFYEINANSAGLTAAQLTEEQYRKYLNGTVIVARSITAEQIAAASITANEIAAYTIKAANLDVADIFAAEATIAQINAMDISGNAYLKLAVGEAAGGINLLKNSGTVVSSNGYPTAIYTLADIPEAGDTVTFTLYDASDVENQGRTWRVYHGDGNTFLGELRPASGIQRYTGTFSFKAPSTANGVAGQIRVYAYPSDTTRTLRIGAAKMEYGTRSTEWTPSFLDPADSVITGSHVIIDDDEVSISTPTFNVRTNGAQFFIPGLSEDGEELVSIDAEGGLSAKKFSFEGLTPKHEGGIYTVGTGGDFVDLAEAFAEINGRYLEGDIFLKMLEASANGGELRGVHGPGRVVITPINLTNNDMGEPWTLNNVTIKTLNAQEGRADDFTLTASGEGTWRWANLDVGHIGALGLRPGTKLTLRLRIQIGSGTAYPSVVAFVGDTYIRAWTGNSGTDQTIVTKEATFAVPENALPWDMLTLQFRVAGSTACTSGAMAHFRNVTLEIGEAISSKNAGLNYCTLGGIEVSGCTSQVCMHSMIFTGSVNAQGSEVSANRCTFKGANGMLVWGGAGAMYNCYGACSGYAARAGGGGAIEVVGSAPSGTTAGLIDDGSATGISPGGGTPTTGGTDSFKAVKSGTYSGSAWWSDKAIRQGRTSENGQLMGGMWFEHSIASSAITKMTLRLKRVEGYGRTGAVTVKIYGTNSAALSGKPVAAGTAVTGTIGQGKTKTFDITSLKAYKGFVIVADDASVMTDRTYSANYARFTGTGGGDASIPLLTITHT